MPWLSPSVSPDGSPRSRTLSTSTNGTLTPNSVEHPATPSITYIPQLIDGACGTTPYSQRSVFQQLSNDVSNAVRLLPALIHGALGARMDIVEMIQHVVLALLETYMLIAAIPLWMCLPGALFAAWLSCFSALIVGISWSLNGRGTMGNIIRSKSPVTDGWMIGQDMEDERWFCVGGMGMSARSLTQKTLPALVKLFNRTIVAFHAPTYGLPFDFLALIIQRSFNTGLRLATSRALYNQIRAALLDTTCNRTVILAHNTGAITMSQVLHLLYADIPAEKMSKLEIYTFGAAAVDFTIPLGTLPRESKKKSGHGSQVHAPEFMTERRGPYIEHFAFTSDPFARMGVLHSVREDLQGRFCGSVFEMNCPGAAHHRHRHSHEMDVSNYTKPSSRPLMSLNDYMSCLFPDHSSTTTTTTTTTMTSTSKSPVPSSQQTRSILESLMIIDRNLAEKREFAALAQHSASIRSKGEKKRLSWTGLGATADGTSGNMNGLVGLEMARKGCKDCKGHRGRDVSRLVQYVGVPTSHDKPRVPSIKVAAPPVHAQ